MSAFTTQDELETRQGRFGAPRYNYLQKLVTEFQGKDAPQEAKLQILANLANFAFDPINYEALRRLSVLDLFLDYLDPSEPLRMREFAMGGLCNCVPDPLNAQFVLNNGGLPLILGCLSSSSVSLLCATIATLIYLATPDLLPQLAAPPVVTAMQRYAQAPDVRIRNLASLYLQHIGVAPPLLPPASSTAT